MIAELILDYSCMQIKFMFSFVNVFSSGAIRDETGNQFVALLGVASVDDQGLVKMTQK